MKTCLLFHASSVLVSFLRTATQVTHKDKKKQRGKDIKKTKVRLDDTVSKYVLNLAIRVGLVVSQIYVVLIGLKFKERNGKVS